MKNQTTQVLILHRFCYRGSITKIYSPLLFTRFDHKDLLPSIIFIVVKSQRNKPLLQCSELNEVREKNTCLFWQNLEVATYPFDEVQRMLFEACHRSSKLLCLLQCFLDIDDDAPMLCSIKGRGLWSRDMDFNFWWLKFFPRWYGFHTSHFPWANEALRFANTSS